MIESESRTFDAIAVGDQLPTLEISESQETINAARHTELAGQDSPRNIHPDPQFAEEGLFAGTVNAGVTTMAYVVQLLERWFPATALYNGGALEFKAIEPFRPGDTVTFTATITGKREEAGTKLVDCEVRGVNQEADSRA